MSSDSEIQLVYDRQCPVCEFYCQRIDTDPTIGLLKRVDARESSDIMAEVTALGLDIDEGMVVKIDDSVYYGSEAIHALASASSGKGMFNRLAAAVFRSRTAARILYPLLKVCRNLLLKVLGRSRINNLRQPGRDSF